MQGHAPIAPSSLSRIVACPGSVALSAAMPPVPESEEAAEGHAAHWVAMQMQQRAVVKENDLTPNGWRVTPEMLEGGEMYVDAIGSPGGFCETTVRVSRIHPTDCWGTPDWFEYDEARKLLRIVDYKFGHLFVDVFENWQMMAYALGVIELLELYDFDVQVQFTVVQPRSFHVDGPVRKWGCSGDKLRSFANRAEHAAAEALSSVAKTHTSTECLFCPARANCVTLANSTASILDWSGDAELIAQDAATIGLRLRMIKEARDRLKSVMTGLEEQALSLMRAGTQIPHWRIGVTNPRERWIGDPEEVAAMIELVAGKNVRKTALPTPNQVRKMGIDAAVISGYVERPSGAAKLEYDDNTLAKRIFSK